MTYDPSLSHVNDNNGKFDDFVLEGTVAGLLACRFEINHGNVVELLLEAVCHLSIRVPFKTSTLNIQHTPTHKACMRERRFHAPVVHRVGNCRLVSSSVTCEGVIWFTRALNLLERFSAPRSGTIEDLDALLLLFADDAMPNESIVSQVTTEVLRVISSPFRNRTPSDDSPRLRNFRVTAHGISSAEHDTPYDA